MLSQALKDKLKANWSLAESMACKAEMRVYDPLSSWQCYIIAMDPNNDDHIMCIISVSEWVCVLTPWLISEIGRSYNSEGERPSIDYDYRPKMASQVFKQLNGGMI
jgi:hypothetical protein